MEDFCLDAFDECFIKICPDKSVMKPEYECYYIINI